MVYRIDTHEAIEIGYHGENLANEILFDISQYMIKWPDATVDLAVSRPGGTYYIAQTQVTKGFLRWLVTASDTAYVGYSEIVIVIKNGDAIGKSAVLKVHVKESLTGTELPTPPEPAQGWVDQVLTAGAEANLSAAQAATSAGEAEVHATSANQAATNAQAANTSAQAHANSAQESKTQAGQYASAAQQGASDATAKAQEATTAADQAVQAATDAKASQVQAQEAATQAQSAASDALTHRDDARTAAQEAQGYAAQAKADSTQAQTSATQATTAAQQAAQDGATANEYGTLAQTMADQAKADRETAVAAAAQAGESALTAQEAQAGAETAQAGAVQAEDKARLAAQQALDAVNYDRFCNWRKATGNPAMMYPVPESTLYPRVELVATQEGEGDPSPDNVRAIVPSIRAGEVVRGKRSGKNLVGMTFEFFGDNVIDGGLILRSWSGEIKGLRTVLKPNTKYHMSFKATKLDGAGDEYPVISSARKGFLLYSATDGVGGTSKTFVMGIREKPIKVGETDYVVNSFTTPSTLNNTSANYKVLAYTEHWKDLEENSTKARPALVEFTEIMLSEVDADYEPYTADTYDLYTADQDLYGLPGAPVVVDAEAGTVTVQDAVKVFDGTEIWGTNTIAPGNRYFVFRLGAMKAYGNGNGVAVSDRYSHGTDPYNRVFYFASAGNTDVLIYPNSTAENVEIPDVAAWKAYLAAQYAAGTPVTVQYPLATPITIPITPPDIFALPRNTRTDPRVNVLSADVEGRTEGIQGLGVTYAKSPIKEIDEIKAAIATLGGTLDV